MKIILISERKLCKNQFFNGRCVAKIKGMYQKNRTEIIYEAIRDDRIENLPDGGSPSAASGASSSSSNLATVNVISIFGGRLQNKRGNGFK